VSRPGDEASRARDVAARLIESGLVDEPLAAEAELHAVPIESPDRTRVGWLVGLVVGDRLIGFVQLDEELRFRRYASFARETPANDWLDPETVLARAGAHSRPGEQLATPFLGYDANPDRVAWVVKATGSEGKERTLLVAGTEVIERPS
jgi:hypothetical protein